MLRLLVHYSIAIIISSSEESDTSSQAQQLRDLVCCFFLPHLFSLKVDEVQIEQLLEKFKADNVNFGVFLKVKSWLKMWEVDGEKARKMYRLLFDALTEDRQRQVKLLQLCDKQNRCQVFPAKSCNSHDYHFMKYLLK